MNDNARRDTLAGWLALAIAAAASDSTKIKADVQLRGGGEIVVRLLDEEADAATFTVRVALRRRNNR